ncbi:gliding motility-associated C-terminal domain-containing protein [Flavobacterium sp.]|uniref:T9SS type B sorting domain-containing protein n=1 Tax=Flavobacterium sp. TaxID=239 RepID=UPI0025C64D9B|nr:gliding motility-associated C-terminal domain-containing protein [Flavobacterium sp.]
MKPQLLKILIASLLFSLGSFAQDISLYQQFNGRYDFVFFGNTMNTMENSYMPVPTVLTSTAADFNLTANDQIEAAYLYWAGCGFGDFQVELNGVPITAERTFAHQWVSGNTYDYFSAFADVTAQVQATGNGTYTLSELDVSNYINFAFTNRTNFAGWAIVVVYKNNSLPLNQLNVYDGMQAVPTEITISLNSLNVIDNVGAKIGFLAWEGDKNIANMESLTINGDVLSNALNPWNNAFNGTNTFTNSDQLYNMDLDVYEIQGNINIGDTTAEITLHSEQDVVMVNAVVTKLNSQLPDATIVSDTISVFCNSQQIVVDYTVSNVNSTDDLEAATPIAFYADGILVGQAATQQLIPIGGSESGQITLTIPDDLPDGFTLTLLVDDNGQNVGVVTELNETNNQFVATVTLLPLPGFNQPENLVSCNLGLTSGTFDFSDYATTIGLDPSYQISFYTSQENAENGIGEILNTGNFVAPSTPFTVYFRVQGADCYNVGSFLLTVRNCPPTVYNFISANGDGINDVFHIAGLRDIFLNYKLFVYNRWGVQIWSGTNNTEEWNGRVSKGLKWSDGEAPDGTYYYVLELHDPDYPKPYSGFLYITQ